MGDQRPQARIGARIFLTAFLIVPLLVSRLHLVAFVVLGLGAVRRKADKSSQGRISGEEYCAARHLTSEQKNGNREVDERYAAAPPTAFNATNRATGATSHPTPSFPLSM